MKNKSPAFQFYPSDFLSDEKVMMMTFEERGLFITLLSTCWLEGSIPSDPEKLERLLQNGGAIKELDFVLKCFVPHPTIEGRLIHKRLEHEREKQAEHSKQKSESGKAGAKKRWENKEKSNKPVLSEDKKENSATTGLPCVSHDSANGKTIANDSSSSPSSFSSSSSKKDIKPLSCPESRKPDSVRGEERGFKFEDEDFEFSKYMLSKVSEFVPSMTKGKNKQPDLKQWANEVRLMRERDGHSVADIRAMYEWILSQPVSNSGFSWKANIRSPGKLREKWLDLEARRMCGTGPPGRSGRNGNQQPHKPAYRL